METIIYGLLVMVINAAILFYVVRKATKANEQIELLKQILSSNLPAQAPSLIATMAAERKSRGL